MRYLIVFLLSISFGSKIASIPKEYPQFKNTKSLRKQKNNAFKTGESLVYSLDWGFINAGQGTLEVLKTEDPNIWSIRFRARANSFFETFYPVFDTNFTLIQKDGLYPLLFEKRLHEGTYHANVSAHFFQRQNKARYIRKNKEFPTDSTFETKPFSQDILSSFYFVRTLPLKVGDTLSLNAVTGAKNYPIKVICHKRTTIKVPAGKFQTLLIEPIIPSEGLIRIQNNATMHVWVTDDEYRIPVKMKTKIKVGSVTASLITYQGTGKNIK